MPFTKGHDPKRNYKGRPKSVNYASKREGRIYLKYGLRDKDYEEILEAQGGGCAVCGTENSGGRFRGEERQTNFAIDHEHIEGYEDMSPKLKRKYVRGLLCYRCNSVVVRLLDEEKQLVEKAQEYLDFHKKKDHTGFRQKKLW